MIAEPSFNKDEVGLILVIGLILVKDMKKIVGQILSKEENFLVNQGSLNRMLLIFHGMNKKSGGVDTSADSVSYFNLPKLNIAVLTWSESA